ncbi:hypothetical protein WDZ16_10310 [Pseudokineococcus marinus]|uniref:Uncharacterized protein n=1 Tax=Pseudokineococcus marinus TaxID=351215 RepID=A0A849BGA1_9ACTN|nr:hypothetical protein [Pseudokineococcus marinus]NNH21591.1 hypothetical protein [Pseudokineococcus marinus]
MPLRRLSTESRAAADAYFTEWVIGGARTLEAFARRLADDGGPADHLDGTPASLTPVFTWVVEHLVLVTDEVVDDGDLPPWCAPGPVTGPSGELDPASARLADGLARYFGEVLVRHVPGARWLIGDEPRHRKTYIDQQWPVVAGHLLAINPLEARGLALKLAGQPVERRRYGWLQENAERYIEIGAQGGAPDEPAWTVDAVDAERVPGEGWRWEVGLDDDLAADDDRTAALTTTLALLPGATAVEVEDRGAWLVAGDVDRAALEAAVRGWAAARR